jgi:hypothetical protein
LISGPAGLFSFGGALTQPLFAGGRIRNGVRLAEAQEEEAVLVYKQTIQRAFQDVSDSLVGYTKDQEFRKQQELLTAAAQDAAHLSDIRYKGGAARGAFGFAFSISAMSRDVGDVGDVGDYFGSFSLSLALFSSRKARRLSTWSSRRVHCSK